MAKKDKRFLVREEEGSGLSIQCTILEDTETGILYLLAKTGYGAGLTPLLDKDGKPARSSGPSA